MANPAHDVLVQALRDNATLLPELLSRLRGLTLPSLGTPIDSSVRLARPVEVRPDIVHRTSEGWVACEVQNKIDPPKGRRWLLVAAVLYDGDQKMGDVVVVTASAAVARWATQTPHVVGPLGTRLQLTPVVLYVSPGDARALVDSGVPELALVAAWAMQDRRGKAAAKIVEDAMAVADRQEPPLREMLQHAIVDVLNETMKSRILEAPVHLSRVPESPATREFRRLVEGNAEARGRAEGEAQGQRKALLLVLAARDIRLTTEERARIEECTDVEQLSAWVQQAATADSVAAVLSAKPRTKKAAPRARRARSTPKRAASR